MKKLLLILSLAVPAFAQHSVTLNWGASPDAGAGLTYNVYKGSGACAAGQTFTKIGSTANGVLTFSDTAVNAGDTDCYQITAVLNGLESVPSPQAQAVILPSPPPSLTTKVN